MRTRPAHLSAALRAHAQGLYCLEAAVELLIGHACWLRRDDFLDRFLRPAPHLIDGTRMVHIDWLQAVAALGQGQLPCSGSEDSMLRLAASLAEGIPLDLRDVLTGLDSHNAELVLHAVMHATGHR